MAGAYPFIDRIDWLLAFISGRSSSFTRACLQIANSEHPETCGLKYNPLTCHGTATTSYSDSRSIGKQQRAAAHGLPARALQGGV